MTIAREIELYNSAYGLAWKHISELQKRVNSNIALRLHHSIRRQLTEGATEPLFVASEALKALDETGNARASVVLSTIRSFSTCGIPESFCPQQRCL
jgi:hypothetical protein